MTKIAFGTYINGIVELDSAVDWPEGTEVEVTPLNEGDSALLHSPGGREKLIARLMEERASRNKSDDL